MRFTITRNGETEPLPYGPFTDEAGTKHPPNALDLWSDEELAAVGVARVPDPPPTPDDLVAKIKLRARFHILARFPEWKQANMTARGVELINLRALNGAWTAEEAAEAVALQADWDWIKAVRAYSDALEAQVPPADDPEALAAFDVSAGWPE